MKIHRTLVEHYNFRVPENIYGFLQLTGVGRKTANLVLASVINSGAWDSMSTPTTPTITGAM